MFIEYIRILDLQSRDPGFGSFQLLSKLFIISVVGLSSIYVGYKLLGKYGAIAVFIIEAGLFVVANDLLPFRITI